MMHTVFATFVRIHLLLIVLGSLVLAGCLSGPGPLRAEDVLTLRSAKGNPPDQRVGEIEDYTGVEIRFLRKLPGGSQRQERIPSDRVIRFQTTWPDAYEGAESHYRKHEYREAVPLYRRALREDPRTWARREILSRLVRCYHNLGEVERAGESFILIYGSDPATHHLAEMPLAWKPGRMQPSLEQQADRWLKSERGSAIRLMGASWLLAGSRRLDATQSLQRLLSDPDRRIAMLAQAQLWRTRLVQLAEADLDGWRKQLEDMPTELRSGPYYLLGRALARHERRMEAALAWMRVPIHDPHQMELASESLLAAASQMETMKHLKESKSLLREIVADYSQSAAASPARQKLEQLEAPD